MAEYQHILKEDHGPVRLLTLNRPEVLNAILPEMEAELHAAFDEAEVDDSVRVSVLTGAGRAFCSGYDMSGSSEREIDYESMMVKGTTAAEHLRNWREVDRRNLIYQTHILKLSKPVIAALHGWLMGGGT